MSHKYLGLFILCLATAAPAQQKPAQPAAAQPGPRPIPRAQFIADMDVEFRKMDADKNGVLVRTEIEQYQKLQAVAQAQARNRNLFARLDADRSGQLSPAEFARLVQAPPAPNPQPMLTRMDSNRDTKISMIEYRTATLGNFDRLDTDKDGVVSPAEMKAAGIAR